MTYRQLSAQALAENDYDSFVTELEKSLTDGRIDPNDVVRETLFEIYFGPARLTREDLPFAARATYHTFDPRNVTTLMTLGESYAVMGRSAEALAVFQRVETLLQPMIARNSNDAQMNMFYGFALYRCNRFDEAIGYLQKAVALDPNSKEGHCFLGYALRGAGRSEEAEIQFRTCVAVNPAFPGRGEIAATHGLPTGPKDFIRPRPRAAAGPQASRRPHDPEPGEALGRQVPAPRVQGGRAVQHSARLLGGRNPVRRKARAHQLSPGGGRERPRGGRALVLANIRTY